METHAFHQKYLAVVYRMGGMGGLRWRKELCDVLEAITEQQLCPPPSTDGKIIWDDDSWRKARKNGVLRKFLDQYRDYSQEVYKKEQRELRSLHRETIREHAPGTPLTRLANLSESQRDMLELLTCQGKVWTDHRVEGPNGELGSMTRTFRGCSLPYKRGPGGDVWLCGACSSLPPEEEDFEQYPSEEDSEYSDLDDDSDV